MVASERAGTFAGPAVGRMYVKWVSVTVSCYPACHRIPDSIQYTSSNMAQQSEAAFKRHSFTAYPSSIPTVHPHTKFEVRTLGCSIFFSVFRITLTD